MQVTFTGRTEFATRERHGLKGTGRRAGGPSFGRLPGLLRHRQLQHIFPVEFHVFRENGEHCVVVGVRVNRWWLRVAPTGSKRLVFKVSRYLPSFGSATWQRPFTGKRKREISRFPGSWFSTKRKALSWDDAQAALCRRFGITTATPASAGTGRIFIWGDTDRLSRT